MTQYKRRQIIRLDNGATVDPQTAFLYTPHTITALIVVSRAAGH
jgi:hypothetical protein